MSEDTSEERCSLDGADAVRTGVGAMGTRFELVLAEAPGLSRASLAAAGEECVAIIRDWHNRLSLFDCASHVSRINRKAGQRPVRADSELIELLERCLLLSEQTGGLFDITAGALMRRWGFRGAASGSDPEWGASLVKLDRDAGTVRFTRSGIEIDLGGVAKGAVLDECVGVLRELGVTSALFHGGTSTITAIGSPPGSDGWRVRIGDSADAPVVSLTDRAMSVSSPAGRTHDRSGHVMDPRTGRPVESLERVTACISPSALDTDAWSTALIVLGEHPERRPDDLTTILAGVEGWTAEGPDAATLEFVPQEVSTS